MSDAPPADRPLPPLPGPPAAHPRSAASLRGYRRSVARSLAASDLDSASRTLRGLAWAVRTLEASDGHHRALSLHVVESAGWMAQRGAGYARQTDGATVPLSARLVRGHLALLPFALALDRWAAPVHARGAGLFVNDLPPIPFPPDV